MPETLDLARHAADSGAHSVSWMVSSFFKPGSAQACAESLAHVANSVPELPVLYYHFPAFSGCAGLKCAEVLMRARELASNVQAAKFTDVDLADFQEGVEAGFCMIIGNTDDMLVPSLTLGACGGYSVASMCGAGDIIQAMWKA